MIVEIFLSLHTIKFNSLICNSDKITPLLIMRCKLQTKGISNRNAEFFYSIKIIKIMRKLINAICLLFMFILVAGCSKGEKQALVKFVVRSNTPEAVVRVMTSFNNEPILIKSYWEKSGLVTVESGTYVRIGASCKDPEVLLTTQIYVNGKLKAERDANSNADLVCQLD